MASTTIQDVTVRPLSAPAGSIPVIFSTNLSTSSTQTSRTISLASAAYVISAQVLSSTGTTTVAVDGSLNPTAGWTNLKTTSWTSTQGGVVRLIQGASTSAKPVTHLRARITDMSTAPGAGGADVTVWLGVL